MLALTACGGGGGGGTVTPQMPPAPPPPPTTTPSITTEPTFTNLSFNQPVALRQAPGDNDRWFVVRKPGVIEVFDNDPATMATSEFIDISADVNAAGEGGLLGLAFHPNFPATPYAYLSYTRTSAPLVSWVSRFTTNDNGQTLDPASELVLFTVEQFDTNHNGGDLAFGPDGFLYAGFGDGGGSGDPQGNGQKHHDDPGLHRPR